MHRSRCRDHFTLGSMHIDGVGLVEYRRPQRPTAQDAQIWQGHDVEVSRYRMGVGAVLLNRDGLVFVGRRIDTRADAWQLPQGGINDGQVPDKAIFRELMEEIGTDRAEIIGESSSWLTYDLPKHLIGRVWNGAFVGQRQLWFAMRFTGNDRDIDLNAGPEPEFDAWRWVRIDDIPSLVVPFKRAMYAQLVEEFGRCAHSLSGVSR